MRISRAELVAILRLDRAAEERLQAMRYHEQRVTLTERLRWRGELVVAAGRRYVIADDEVSRTSSRRPAPRS